MPTSNYADYADIADTAYDLIVIGGGINGAAVARDAALRGLNTLLLEKNDFAAGSTSWSTRLIHGGLRYLEYFEINLVRESLREREILLQTAPHLVKPVQMTIPIYAQGSRSYWEIQAGMLLYDVLSYDKTLPNHRMLPAAKLHQLFRGVNPENCRGAAQYYDGEADYSERLCLEIVLSAQAAGATTLNYVTASQLQRQDGRVTAVICEDSLTGERFTVRSHPQTVVINAAGPWVDEVCRRAFMGETATPIGQTQKIGGTKGSHIFVDPFPGAPPTALYVEALTDGRPFFILPRLGLYLIGTTDIPFDGDLDRVKASDDEIDYLLRETNRVIPSARLTRESVRFTYSGVRPLPYEPGKKPGSITRKHILHDHKAEGVENLISLIGGKLTTHRQVGEEMVDAALKKQGRPSSASPTRQAPLPGAIWPNDERLIRALEDYSGTVGRESIDHLFGFYGARAPEVLALVDEAPELAQRITPELPDILAQVVYAVRSEMARTLEDVARRRTAIGVLAGYGFAAAPAMVAVLKTHCGWSEGECDRTLAAYTAFMRDNCIPDYQLADYAAVATVG